MKLVALLMVLALERFWPLGRYVRHDGWFVAVQNWMDHNVLDSAARYFCAVLIPAFIIALIICLFENQFWGVLGFLCNVFVLLYVIGRGQLTEKIENYLSDWRTGDVQGAALYAQTHLGIDREFVENAAELQHKVRNHILYCGLTDFFVIVFWYLVLGVFGALVAFFTQLYVLYATGEARQWSQKARHIIEWIPARLLGLTFAFAGNFGTCFGEWVEYISQTKMSNMDFLTVCGVSAIGLTDIVEEEEGKSDEPSRDYLYKSEQEIRALVDLIQRSRYVWVAIIAVAIVLGWL